MKEIFSKIKSNFVVGFVPVNGLTLLGDEAAVKYFMWHEIYGTY